MGNLRKSLLIKSSIAIHSPEALIDAVRGFLIETQLDTAKICVGLSGGVDSIVLLHVLSLCQKTLPFQLSAVHVNHGISPHAQAWSDFAQSYTESLGYSCAVHCVDLVKRSAEGLEALARKARYAVYEALTCDAIALAHHQDDQAETLLLQLLRGSGVVGLAAMPKKRPMQSDKHLIRPFLDVSRACLLSYAKAYQLTWVEDESNQDTRFRRNFLRHEILPRLQQHYPKPSHILSRAAHYFSETSELLADLAEQDCPQIKSLEPLPRAVLLPLSDTRQRNVLYWYLRAQGIFPDEKWIIEIQKTMHAASKESSPTFVLQGKELYLAYDNLFVVPVFSPPEKEMGLEWRGEAEIAVHEWRGTLQFIETKGLGLSANILKEKPLILKGRQGGERLKQAVTRPSHTIKNLWQEAKISFWQRQRVPFVWHGEKLLMVPGAGQACETEIGEQEIGIVLVWKPWDFCLFL